MSKVSSLALAVLATAVFCSARVAPAQISINFGVEPVCPYGYYDYAPYNCSPYGYYGPDWFSNGVFIGAGRWFRGPGHFYGHVDNRYDPRHGYRGPMPNRGEEPSTTSTATRRAMGEAMQVPAIMTRTMNTVFPDIAAAATMVAITAATTAKPQSRS